MIVTAQHRRELYTTLTMKDLRNDKLWLLDPGDLSVLFMVEDWPNESQFMMGWKRSFAQRVKTARFEYLVNWCRCSARKAKPPPPCGSRNCGIS